MSRIIRTRINTGHNRHVASSNVALKSFAMFEDFPDLHVLVRYIEKQAPIHHLFHHRIDLFRKRFRRDFGHLKFT